MTVRSALRAPIRAAVRAPIVLRKRPDEFQALIDSLFGNGEQGLFFVPEPGFRGEDVLYQDAAGTTLADANGDPVGRADEFSGNDNSLTQPTSADRPLYQTDGSLHWLEFDGAGDLLQGNSVTIRTASAVVNFKSNISVLLAVKSTYQYAIGMSNDSIYLNNADNGGSTESSALNRNEAYLVTVGLWGNGRAFVRLNGVDATLSGGNTAPITGDVLLGYRWTGSDFNWPFLGDTQGIIFSDAEWSVDQINEVEAYLAKRAGITL